MTQNIIDTSFGRYYEKSVLRHEDASDVIESLNKRLQASELLRNDAKQRLSEMPELLEKRCVVTKKKREFLTQALEGLS